jgi:Ammonium Transporter Family
LPKLLGTFILWFGWYSFNSLSAILTTLNETTARVAGLAAVTSTISAGTASMVALILNYWLRERQHPGYGVLDLQFAMNGSLGGLVTITACCAVVEPWAALVIGVLSACAYVGTNRLLSRFRIDDAVDAVPVHLACGVMGLVCVGLFSSPTRQLDAYGRADHVGLFYSWGNGEFDAVLLGTQLLGTVIVLLWVTAIMLPFFYFLDRFGWLRCDVLEEIVGLDCQHTPDLVESIPVNEIGKEDEINIDHFEAYKKRRQAKNDDILRKREALNNFGKAVSSRLSVSSRRESVYSDIRSVTLEETGPEMSKQNSFRDQKRTSWSPNSYSNSRRVLTSIPTQSETQTD